MRIQLTVTEGPAKGRIFDFDTPNMFMFGRAPDAHCPILTDNRISRRHFLLQFNPPECTLLDLKSSNGTRVNNTWYGGKRADIPPECQWREVETVRLNHGDVIVAGQSHFALAVKYDLLCGGCGTRYSVEGAAGADGRPYAALCPHCSDQGVKPGASTHIMVCSQCGSDATEEVGVRATDGSVEYVCEACRDKLKKSKAVRKHITQLRISGQMPAVGQGVPVEELSGIELGDAPKPPVIKGFEYLRLLGMGGMGAVYLARETSTGELVAIKSLLPRIAMREDIIDKFQREFDVCKSLKHANIVDVHECNREGAVFYCIMEFVDGMDADSLMAQRSGKIPVAEAVDIAIQSLDGLAAAHAQGVIHRDFKPENVLLKSEGKAWTAKVADFGLAKNFEEAGLSGLTLEGEMCGSLPFMPREQLVRYRWVRPTSDVYAAAASFYYMLTGCYPKDGFDVEYLSQPAAVNILLNSPVVPIQERDNSIPAPIAEVINLALHEEENKRYRDAGEMRDELKAAVERQ